MTENMQFKYTQILMGFIARLANNIIPSVTGLQIDGSIHTALRKCTAAYNLFVTGVMEQYKEASQAGKCDQIYQGKYKNILESRLQGGSALNNILPARLGAKLI